MSPTPEEFPIQEDAPANRRGLAYVQIAESETLRFLGTPTTILVGANNRIVWGKLGAISRDDLRLADQALNRLIDGR